MDSMQAQKQSFSLQNILFHGEKRRGQGDKKDY